MSEMRKFIPLAVGILCMAIDRLFEIDLTGMGVQCAFIGALIAGLASVAGGVAGSISANNRKNKAESLMDQRKRTLDIWRNAELGSDYLDRADSRAAMRRVMEYNTEAQKASDTNAIKRGMTDEAKVAQAGRLNRNYADVVSQIAGAGARHKDAVQQQYLGATMNLDNIRIGNLMDTSGAESMVNGITGAAGALGSALQGSNVAGKGGGLQKVKSMAQTGHGMPSWNKYTIN